MQRNKYAVHAVLRTSLNLVCMVVEEEEGGGGGRGVRKGWIECECAVVVSFNNAFCLRDVDEVKHAHVRARGCRERERERD